MKKRKVANEEVSETLGLFMFVHLAIAEDADKSLAASGMSRTHHRILFLVARKPRITVGETVALLRVSAQAIQAPLRALIDGDFIQQESSERDRRKRHLVTTKRGANFLAALSKAQHSRIASALAAAGPEKVGHFMRILRSLMDASDRDWLYPEEPVAALRRA